MIAHRPQHGSALISVIVLIVIIGVLGAVAIRGTTSQQQMANLALLESRAEAAAYSGAEYAAHELQASRPCPAQLPLPAIRPSGMENVTVQLACVSFNTPGGVVHDVRSTASFGVFGGPEFVQRVNRRRLSTIGTGSWEESQERFP